MKPYAHGMGKLWFCLVAVALAVVTALARPISIPTLPVSLYADTEVSTNIVIHPSRTDVRDVKLHLDNLQLAGTAYNELEVSFGCDVNTNGVLDVDEVETVYGWRGGRYFIENVRTWERFETEANNVQRGVFDVHMVLDSNSSLTSFTATCGGETAFSDFSTAHPPSWLYGNNWKLLRVVRRGAAAPGEWVRCEVGYNFFVIKLR
jgi:hypothetical protein